MSELPPEVFLKCENCGEDRSLHFAANLTDGNFIGQYLLICPKNIFKAKDYNQFGIPYSQEKK
jgi:hypothetical protein